MVCRGTVELKGERHRGPVHDAFGMCRGGAERRRAQAAGTNPFVTAQSNSLRVAGTVTSNQLRPEAKHLLL